MFDGVLFGYVASGNSVYFRSFSSTDVFLFTVPEDLDTHDVTNALNAQANVIMDIFRLFSAFKF